MAYNFKSENDVQDYVKNLGIEYRFGCFSEKKPEVCHLLADYLESIKKDYEKAGKVYKNNCDDYKYGKSCLKYATYTLIGKGVKDQDYNKACSYFEKGCNLDNPESCLNQGLLLVTNNEQYGLKQNIPKGMEVLEKACSAKNGNACYYLSGMYIGGVRKPECANKSDLDLTKDDFITQKDMKKAFGLALEGCNLDNMYCCVNLSQMYSKGDGVEKNTELAEKYKEKALELQQDAQNGKTLTFQEGLKS